MDEDCDSIRAIVSRRRPRLAPSGACCRRAGTFDGSLTQEEAKTKFPRPQRSAITCRTPVIAAINGAAVGAGNHMACARHPLAPRRRSWDFVFNPPGRIPDADLCACPGLIGYARAMDLLLTATDLHRSRGRARRDARLAARLPARRWGLAARSRRPRHRRNNGPRSRRRHQNRRPADFLEETDRPAALA